MFTVFIYVLFSLLLKTFAQSEPTPNTGRCQKKNALLSIVLLNLQL